MMAAVVAALRGLGDPLDCEAEDANTPPSREFGHGVCVSSLVVLGWYPGIGTAGVIGHG